MSRVTMATLERRISYLWSKGVSIGYDKQLGGYRFLQATQCLHISSNRYISPRLNLKGAIDWLEALETGIEIGKEMQFNKMRKEVADTTQSSMADSQARAINSGNGGGR